MRNPTSYRQRSGGHGFTLLEVVFVLGMIAMMTVWLTLSVTSVDTEQQLREASGGIESMVKRARTVAVMQQRPYQVTITEDRISLAPQYTQSVGDMDGFDEDDDVDVTREDFEDIIASEETDLDLKYEVRRWRSDLWLEIKGEEKVVLTLDPLGLVEPISIRCSVGKSWLIQELHPLTGGVRDEEMSVEED